MHDDLKLITRRALFQKAGWGVGSLALGSLLTAEASAQQPPSGLHFPARAKRVIFLFMAGAPSQVDLFDPKPTLQRLDGQPCPEEILQGEQFAFIKGTPKLLGSPFEFEQCGQSGAWVSELLPHFKTIVDDVAIVRSMQTDQINHAPAQIFMNTGFQIPGRPSMGSWLTYGIGAENRDLPGFVVLVSGENNPDGGKACWSSGFLPSVHQGVELRSQGDPVLFVGDPDGVDRGIRRRTLDALGDLNRLAHERLLDPEIQTRIEQYELAYRMQSSVPELMDLSGESQAVKEEYGAVPGEKSFANNCLLARRLAERGVRFIQLYHRGWDHHGNAQSVDIEHGLPRLCREVDQPMAALVRDLKRLGMLEDTLVVWGGEFGRTPMNEGRGGAPYKGRDHHPRAFTMWMAGGGIKPGVTYGETDEIGYNVAADPVHVHDLHATMLHLLGIDHTRLTFMHQGRQYRLTDVHGRLVEGLIS